GARPVSAPHLASPARGRRLVKPADAKALSLTPEQRLLLLDTWRRSGLPAQDFAALVGLSKYTLYAWKKKFDGQGPAGLLDQPPRGARGGPPAPPPPPPPPPPAQGAPPRRGLPAHPRRPAARPGPARRRRRRRPRPARGRLPVGGGAPPGPRRAGASLRARPA